MNILVGNDSKSTAAGITSSLGQISLLITGFLAVVAQNDPTHHTWVWVILSAGVVCALGVARIVIGIKMNYLQTDPNIGNLANPAVVTVQTTGPVPTATLPSPALDAANKA